MNEWTHEDIDSAFKNRHHVEQLIRRCAIFELRYECLEKWMQEHDPQALDAILEATKDLGYDMKLEYQKKVGQIVRDVGGTLEL